MVLFVCVFFYFGVLLVFGFVVCLLQKLFLCSRIKKCVKNLKSHQYIVIQHQWTHSQTCVSIFWGLLQPGNKSRLATENEGGWVLLYILCCFLATTEIIFYSILCWILFNLCENTAALGRPHLVYSNSQSIVVISSMYNGKPLEEMFCEVSTISVIKSKPKHSLSKMLCTAFLKYRGR